MPATFTPTPPEGPPTVTPAFDGLRSVTAMTAIDRRTFITRAVAAAGTATVASGSLVGLLARAAGAAPGGRALGSQAATRAGGYGPLRDLGELWLPEGFRYVGFGRQGSPLALTRGGPVVGTLPRGHDGMASFPAGAGRARLVRNHENRTQPSPLGGGGYDPDRFGGTTTMEFDVGDPADAGRDGARFLGQWTSLRGTSTNCAGGPTPWRSWLTCEETVETVGGTPHGYVFDVPSAADGPVEAVPLRAMGRFVHEAVAVDPRTGIAYETEDRRIGGEGTGSGFYRFTPTGLPYGTAGRLEMLAVKGRPNYDTSTGQRVGQVLPVTWVAVADPDPAGASGDSQAVFRQGWAEGGARFNRLEGAWYGDGSIFFISTNGGDPSPGGDPGLGQVWRYIPLGGSGGQLVLLVESRDADVMEAPDNITVSPRGGLLVCEDGDGAQYLRGVTRDGRVFDFATHNLAGSNEFAGANWSPDGEWLFVNVQEPGVTYAVTGPWRAGAL